jgi:hypothetical protein
MRKDVGLWREVVKLEVGLRTVHRGCCRSLSVEDAPRPLRFNCIIHLTILLVDANLESSIHLSSSI